MHARLISLATAFTALTVLGACDQSTTDEPDTSFRGRDDIGVFVGGQAGISYKDGGCDNPIDPEDWIGPDGGLAMPEYELDNRIYQARINGDSALVTAFLAQPGVEEFCSAQCGEQRSEWTGDAAVQESSHEIGDIAVVGECPNGGYQTNVEVRVEGSVGCACAF